MGEEPLLSVDRPLTVGQQEGIRKSSTPRSKRKRRGGNSVHFIGQQERMMKSGTRPFTLSASKSIRKSYQGTKEGKKKKKHLHFIGQQEHMMKSGTRPVHSVGQQECIRKSGTLRNKRKRKRKTAFTSSVNKSI